MRKRLPLIVLVVAIAAGVGYYIVAARPPALTLTGIVTTNDVIVSPQIGGQLASLLVKEGDQVQPGQLLAMIAPDELRADVRYSESSAAALGSQVQESEAALRFQQQQMTDQIRQAEATLASTVAQQRATAADLENARLVFERNQKLSAEGVTTAEALDQSRTAYDAAKARVDALNQQVDAQRAAVALARSNAEQVSERRSQVAATEHQRAAASAQRTKADVRLAYSEIKAPIAGIVDVLASRQGEVVTPGQPIVTLVNPDDLWVRVDVEETYIDGVRIGDRLTVRLPSGVEREGTVFYRGADASFATQRDVSRTKRDIKTFEVRLRVDNSDRRLALGMTTYVLLPIR